MCALSLHASASERGRRLAWNPQGRCPDRRYGGVVRLRYSSATLTALAMVSTVGYTNGSRAGLKGIWTLAVPSR
jgi:hypothetical protein